MTIQLSTVASASSSHSPAGSPPVAADISPIARLYTNLEAHEPVYWDHHAPEPLNYLAQPPDHAVRNAIRDQWRVITDTLIQATNDYHASLSVETFTALHQNLSALGDQMQKDDAFALEACKEEIKSRLEIIAATMLGDDSGRTPSRPEILQRLSDAMVLFPAVSAQRKVLSTLTYLHSPPQQKVDAQHGAHVGTEDRGKDVRERLDAAGRKAGDHQSDAEDRQLNRPASPERALDPGSPYLKLSSFPIRDRLAHHLELEDSPQRVALNMSRIHEIAQESAGREQYDRKDNVYRKEPCRLIYPSQWNGVSGTQICMLHERDKNALVRLLEHFHQTRPTYDSSLLAAIAAATKVEVYNPKAVQLILEAYPASHRKMADVKTALMNAMKSGQLATVDVLLDKCYDLYKATGEQKLSGIYNHALTCPNAEGLVNTLLAHEQRLKALNPEYDMTALINMSDDEDFSVMDRWANNDQVAGKTLHMLIQNGARAGRPANHLKYKLALSIRFGSISSTERILSKCYSLYKATGLQSLSGMYHYALTCPNATKLVDMLAAYEKTLLVLNKDYDPTILINEQDESGRTPLECVVSASGPLDLGMLEVLLHNNAHISPGLQFSLAARLESKRGNDGSFEGFGEEGKVVREARLIIEEEHSRRLAQRRQQS